MTLDEVRRTLYKDSRKEYGGALVTKVYVDGRDGRAHQCGWAFTKTMRYEDSPDKRWRRTVWVTLEQRVGDAWREVRFDRPDYWTGC